MVHDVIHDKIGPLLEAKDVTDVVVLEKVQILHCIPGGDVAIVFSFAGSVAEPLVPMVEPGKSVFEMILGDGAMYPEKK
jgi:hypothetical protein